MDNSIVQQIRNGDKKARTEFYKRYRLKLYHYCYQLLGNRSDAEDTVHETFIKIFNGINNLQSTAAFRTWMYTIARNEALQLIRKRRPNVPLNKLELADGQASEARMESDDIAQIVQKEIDTMKSEYREIIFLREYHHLSYDEIALVTGITVSAVKTRLFRARKSLFKKLSNYFDGR